MGFIIFDYEVYKHDTLLGALIVSKDGLDIMQTWSIEEIQKFYNKYKNFIWIGHNNTGYDNFILENCITLKKDMFQLSKELINDSSSRYKKFKIPYLTYDIMTRHFGSLKAIEGAEGKTISETKVNFDIDRPLTEEEKLLVESYNLDDLEQTYDNFISTIDELILRLDIKKEFNLDDNILTITGTQIAETVLGAEYTKGIENWYVAPKMYDNLQVNNKELIDYYLTEGFRQGRYVTIKLCGVNHKFASGGVHAAKKKYHIPFAFYFDVSGYYNLIMLLLDLLPRSIPTKGKQLYEYMYHEQLKLKKTNPRKRAVFKEILLCVFGAMTNDKCRFYDPNHGTLVTMVGQMYLADLLEKLEGKVDLVQSNTDGVIAAPLPGINKEEIVSIINEWQERTGFVLKLEEIYDIHQRDVNNYMYKDSNGEIHVIGEAIKYYHSWENVLQKNCFFSKEPIITHEAIVEFFMNNILPEKYIESVKRNLRLFQQITRKGSFERCEYEVENLLTGEKNRKEVQNVNRVFALKSDEYQGMIYKCNKDKEAKISNLPDSVFIYNESILDEKTITTLIDKINYQYYVDRCYERIAEFIDIVYVKDLKL